jgi:large subunit ribosomal protein L29
MKNAEITNLNVEELNERLVAERSSARNMRFAHAISPLENPIRMRESRKTIARLMTEIRKREMSQNS